MPLCGGRGRVRHLRDGYRIVCKVCGASSHYVFIQKWHDSKDVAQCQVAKVWNTRSGNCNYHLTLNELRKMEGTPVWIRAVDADEIGNKNTWGMVYFDDAENGHATVFWFGNECEDEPKLSDYGKTWTAYHHKPEVQS